MAQDLNATFRFARLVVFGVASLFAFLVLALGASITNFTTSRTHGGYFSFAALGIADGILTIFTLPAMIWVSIHRKTAITSMVAVEVAWIWFLWIMWLALAGQSASTGWLGDCSWFGDSQFETMCRQTQALTAFAFLTWLILLAYGAGLIFLVVRQHTRGNATVWNGFILETDFAAGGVNSGKSLEAGGVEHPAQYPPATQQPYTTAAQPN